MIISKCKDKRHMFCSVSGSNELEALKRIFFQTWKRWSSKFYSQNFGGWFPPKHPQLLYQSEIFWLWLCQTCCQIQMTQKWLELQESLKFVNNSISTPRDPVSPSDNGNGTSILCVLEVIVDPNHPLTFGEPGSLGNSQSINLMIWSIPKDFFPQKRSRSNWVDVF